MEEHTFEKLAADAAAGLQADQEVYRDVTQELHTFLEDKAERYRREGHSDEESVALAKKAFGSPLDVAAELLTANRGRLRLRALLRIGFNAVIIPLAVLLALYTGYGRLARLQGTNAWLSETTSSEPTVELPTLPFLGLERETDLRKNTTLIGQLYGSPGNADAIRRYWQAHRSEPDSQMIYAYFAVFDTPQTEEQYVRDMRLGEQIEPQNALYNVLLADYYLKRGVLSKEDNRQNDLQPDGDLLLDRRAMELGIAEMRKAAVKPYLRDYQMEILKKRLDSLPRPLLTEDYLTRLNISAGVMFPEFVHFRDVARKTLAAARLLAAEGRSVEAEAVMDTGRPYSLLLARDNNAHLIGVLVSQAIAILVAQDGAQVYRQLGKPAKAREAQAAFERLQELKTARKRGKTTGVVYEKDPEQHASQYADILLPVFPLPNKVPPITDRDLKPSRMHEHVLYEETGVGLLQSVLALLLLGTVLQGILWHFRLRGASSVPLLLLPPAREFIRVLWWGLVLPILVYAVYSRLPIIGGREFNWSAHWWRFGPELLVLGILVLWLPARMIHRCVRRRCDDLDISMPPACEERSVSLRVRGMVYTAIVLAVIALGLPVASTPAAVKLGGIVIALLLIVLGVRYAAASRRDYGLYYGTLARSLAPLYAFAILLLALTVQPLLLSREAAWLRKDTLMWGHGSTLCTSIEARVAQDYSRQLVQILEKR